MKKIVEIFYKNLDKDINFNEITYEREVISIPAADTINLIYGKLYCEVCGIDDEIVLDVHHDKVSVANMKEGHITKLDDLRVICANCHRKVHGLKVTVDRLIEINDGINFK